MRSVLWAAVVGIGCSGAKGGGDDTGGGGGDDGGGGGSDRFAEFINVTTAPVGDFTGFEAGFDGNGGAWLSQTVDPAKVTEVGFTGTVEDFQENTPVADATVEMWFSDVIAGSPDFTDVSDAAGLVTGTVPTCAPLAYKTSTDPALAETKNTFEAHQVYGADASVDDILNSVSTTTYQIIPSLLGVSPDGDKGTVAGTAYDSNGDPVEGAQVVVKDANGNIPDSLVVKYFVDSFPNRNQLYTSPDGLWVAINLPPGEYTIEMYVSDGADGHLLMGATVLSVYADSINISNVYTGFGDGVKYPASCLAG